MSVYPSGTINTIISDLKVLSIEENIVTVEESEEKSLELTYAVRGTNKDRNLLLLPGLCDIREVWDEIVRLSSRKAKTYALDWRSHGTSQLAHRDFSVKDLLRDALGVVEQEKLENLVVITLGQAGWVGVMLRKELGSKVSHLVLIDWPAQFSSTTAAELEDLISGWITVSDNSMLGRYKRVVQAFPKNMWSWAAAAVNSEYGHIAPLDRLSELSKLDEEIGLEPLPVLHLHSQEARQNLVGKHENFDKDNTWYTSVELCCKSHYQILENPYRHQASNQTAGCESLSQTFLL